MSPDRAQTVSGRLYIITELIIVARAKILLGREEGISKWHTKQWEKYLIVVGESVSSFLPVIIYIWFPNTFKSFSIKVQNRDFYAINNYIHWIAPNPNTYKKILFLFTKVPKNSETMPLLKSSEENYSLALGKCVFFNASIYLLFLYLAYVRRQNLNKKQTQIENNC